MLERLMSSTLLNVVMVGLAISFAFQALIAPTTGIVALFVLTSFYVGAISVPKLLGR